MQGTYSSVIAYVLDFHWLSLGDELMILRSAHCIDVRGLGPLQGSPWDPLPLDRRMTERAITARLEMAIAKLIVIGYMFDKE